MRAETRHQLKQDAFSRATMEAAERTAHWSVEHQSTLIIAAIVVTVVLFLIYNSSLNSGVTDMKAISR